MLSMPLPLAASTCGKTLDGQPMYRASFSGEWVEAFTCKSKYCISTSNCSNQVYSEIVTILLEKVTSECLKFISPLGKPLYSWGCPSHFVRYQIAVQGVDFIAQALNDV